MQAKKRKQREEKEIEREAEHAAASEHQNCICMAKSAGNAVDAILFGSRLCSWHGSRRAIHCVPITETDWNGVSRARRGGGA